MANQVEPGTMGDATSGSVTSAGTTWEGAQVRGGSTAHGEIDPHSSVAALGPYPAYHGRRVSWIAVGIMMAGFLVGGLALVFGTHGPTWWLFWVGAAISVVGLLAMLATNTFEDWY
jgi:hypothetical protein